MGTKLELAAEALKSAIVMTPSGERVHFSDGNARELAAVVLAAVGVTDGPEAKAPAPAPHVEAVAEEEEAPHPHARATPRKKR